MSFFSKESEERKAKDAPKGFWQDGVAKKCVISESWRPSKKNPEKQVRWLSIYDIDSCETRENPEFTLQDALSKLEDGVKYEGMVMLVTPIFDKEENGFKRFNFNVEPTGEYVEVPVKTSDIAF